MGWLILNDWIAPDDTEPGSGQLAVYSGGKVRTVECGPFTIDFWFWQHGRYVAIDCGGRHFAGQERSFKTDTLEEVDSFDQAEVPRDRRPPWSSTGANFDDEGNASKCS